MAEINTLRGKATLPQTLSQHVAEIVRSRIISGHYLPGDSLPETEFQKEFGCSRAPIREAFRILSESGLVDHKPRRGFSVHCHDADSLKDLYRLRALLESFVIDEIAERADLSVLTERLEKLLESMDQSFLQNDLDIYFGINVEFHNTLIEFADNKPLERISTSLNEMSLPVRNYLLRRKFPDRSIYRYHKELVEHIKNREFSEARSLVKSHVLNNLEDLARYYPANLKVC